MACEDRGVAVGRGPQPGVATAPARSHIGPEVCRLRGERVEMEVKRHSHVL